MGCLPVGLHDLSNLRIRLDTRCTLIFTQLLLFITANSENPALQKIGNVVQSNMETMSHLELVRTGSAQQMLRTAVLLWNF